MSGHKSTDELATALGFITGIVLSIAGVGCVIAAYPWIAVVLLIAGFVGFPAVWLLLRLTVLK